MACTMAQCSASLEDLDTIVFFLVFQDTWVGPSFIKLHDTDFWVNGQEAIKFILHARTMTWTLCLKLQCVFFDI